MSGTGENAIVNLFGEEIQHDKRIPGKHATAHHQTEETRKKISETMKGYKWTDHQRETFVEKRKAMWADPEYKAEMRKRMLAGHHNLPNKSEQKLRSIVHMITGGLFQYTGDGKLFIGNRCPDFVDHTQRRVIELFGEFWHKAEDEQDRIEHYKSYGYTTLVIWDDDLRKDNSSVAIEKIFAFLGHDPQKGNSADFIAARNLFYKRYKDVIVPDPKEESFMGTQRIK